MKVVGRPRSLRKLARAIAPHGAVVLHDALTTIDLDRAALIRDAPRELLRDPAWLEHDLLPRLGLARTGFDVFPAEHAERLGDGLQPFQWPNQFAPYLATLSRLGIRSYLEVGVFRGGTFVATVEYLHRFTPIERAYAVDVDRSLALMRYRLRRPAARFVHMSTADPSFPTLVRGWSPDLVLIDGDHSYEAVRRDFAAVDGVARAIALHDVVDNGCVGVQRAWREVREEHADAYDFAEFTEQYPEVQKRVGGTLLGIGLAVRKDFGPPLADLLP